MKGWKLALFLILSSLAAAGLASFKDPKIAEVVLQACLGLSIPGYLAIDARYNHAAGMVAQPEWRKDSRIRISNSELMRMAIIVTVAALTFVLAWVFYKPGAAGWLSCGVGYVLEFVTKSKRSEV